MSKFAKDKDVPDKNVGNMGDLISRQAAIDAFADWFNGTEITIMELTFSECKSVIKSLPSAQPDLDEWCTTCKEYDQERHCCPRWNRVIRETLMDAQPEQKWIPCSERMPEEEKKSYWVCNDAGQQFECRWTNVNHFWTTYTGDWHWHLLDIPQYTKVVAWMPLPEPYKEETNDPER